eukprot:7382588-Prymnesium_polylepis.1
MVFILACLFVIVTHTKQHVSGTARAACSLRQTEPSALPPSAACETCPSRTQLRAQRNRRVTRAMQCT